MLLRKLLVILLPLLICLLLAVTYPLLGSLLAQQIFWQFTLKGALTGAALALLVPLMGGRKREEFSRLYWAPTALIFLLLLYQCLQQAGALKTDPLAFISTMDTQILLVESAFFGFLLTLSIRASR